MKGRPNTMKKREETRDTVYRRIMGVVGRQYHIIHASPLTTEKRSQHVCACKLQGCSSTTSSSFC